MGKPTGFMESGRQTPRRRPVQERVKDWKEYETHLSEADLAVQAARCMDCGVPFCHQGCPLNNLIPDWNDLAYKGQWKAAIQRLHATNNFPEFTGTLCPAPCENSCTLAMDQHQAPIIIKQIEKEIIARAWAEGWVQPLPPARETGKKVAVVGSGPAGMAAAQQLRRVGHAVTLFERADRLGGLMRYGIPEFKMEKRVLDRRLAQMKAEGVVFKAGVEVGKDLPAALLLKDFDAVVLTGGSTMARDLPVPGRELKGVHFAMEYLKQSNQAQEGDKVAGQILAKGLDVVVVGGGDTGADCIGTAIRQGAKSVVNLEVMPQPPEKRSADNPWPQWARIFRTAGAHEEGVERMYSIQVKGFEGEGGRVKSLKAAKLDWSSGKPQEVPGSEFSLPAGLVTLAMGFTGPEKGLLAALGVELDARGNAKAGADKMTSVKGVFTAGDMTRGQSLIVWAIREGRVAAHHVDKHLMGQTSLPC